MIPFGAAEQTFNRGNDVPPLSENSEGLTNWNSGRESPLPTLMVETSLLCRSRTEAPTFEVHFASFLESGVSPNLQLRVRQQELPSLETC